MKTLRTVLFWCHLAAGSAAGLVILIMAGTGTLLALAPNRLRFQSLSIASKHGLASGSQPSGPTFLALPNITGLALI